MSIENLLAVVFALQVATPALIAVAYVRYVTFMHEVWEEFLKDGREDEDV